MYILFIVISDFTYLFILLFQCFSWMFGFCPHCFFLHSFGFCFSALSLLTRRAWSVAATTTTTMTVAALATAIPVVLVARAPTNGERCHDLWHFLPCLLWLNNYDIWLDFLLVLLLLCCSFCHLKRIIWYWVVSADEVKWTKGPLFNVWLLLFCVLSLFDLQHIKSMKYRLNIQCSKYQLKKKIYCIVEFLSKSAIIFFQCVCVCL